MKYIALLFALVANLYAAPVDLATATPERIAVIRGQLGLGTAATADTSTTGGVAKVLLTGADGTITVGVLLADAAPGTWLATGVGNIIIPDARGVLWNTAEGTNLARMYYSDAHDLGGGELAIISRNRIAFGWGSVSGDSGFQLGNLARSGEFVYLQKHGPATAGDTVRESKAWQWRGASWYEDATHDSSIICQYVPTTTAGTGALKFNLGTAGTDSDSNGRITGTHVFSIADTGPVIAAGKVLTFGDGSTMAIASAGGGTGTVTSVSGGTTGLTFGATPTVTPEMTGTLAIVNGGTGTATGSMTAVGDWSLTQNSVGVINSIESGALVDTIRLQTGRVRVGANTNLSGTLAVAFEVAPQIAGIVQTSGDFYVGNDGTVYVGRLSATGSGGLGRQIWQGRTGVAQMTFHAGGDGSVATATFASTIVQSNTTDSTTTTTGAVKTAGGMGIVKNLHVGGSINGSAGLSVSGGPIINGAPQLITGNGSVAAVSLLTECTVLTNNGIDDTVTTLANGTEGQTKIIACENVAGFACAVTVNSYSWAGTGNITLSAASDSITLKFLNGMWFPTALVGTVVTD